MAAFFAMNIGASGAAAAMGSPYGGRVVGRRQALVLVCLFSVLGAILGGGEVVRTVSGGIVPAELVTPPLAVAILACAAGTLFVANRVAVPLSTSEVTVGAMAGSGLALGSLYGANVLEIASVWALLPLLALVLSYALTRLLLPPSRHLLRGRHGLRVSRGLGLALLAGGCYVGFAAGTNNVANAVAPLVAAGLLETGGAQLLGGLALGAGALALGGRVLETNGTGITSLSPVSAGVASFTSGSLVIVASLYGIPVPLTQVTTVAIVGAGLAAHGRRGLNASTLRRIAGVWVASPLVAGGVSCAAVLLITRAGPAAHGVAVGIAATVLLGAIAVGRCRGGRRQEPAPDAAKPEARGGEGRAVTGSGRRRRGTAGPPVRVPGARPVPRAERAVLLDDAGRPRR